MFCLYLFYKKSICREDFVEHNPAEHNGDWPALDRLLGPQRVANGPGCGGNQAGKDEVAVGKDDRYQKCTNMPKNDLNDQTEAQRTQGTELRLKYSIGKLICGSDDRF